MKILYAIQGTGNGHLTRALSMVPALQKIAEVDVLLSGTENELQLPFALTHRCFGLGFVFGKKGGIDYLGTYKKARTRRFLSEVRNLNLKGYHAVVSDFEPVSAWAASWQGVPCIGLSNQCALLSPAVPKAESPDLVGKLILKHYAPCNAYVGLSYQAYGPHVHTPLIRRELRGAPVSHGGPIVVYLPAVADTKLITHLQRFLQDEFLVFSKTALAASQHKNVRIEPLNRSLFEMSICRAAGVITAAGFGTTTEALFLGKKLLVVPQKHQFEQACNAAALCSMGVLVLKSLKAKHDERIVQWLSAAPPSAVDYPDNADAVAADVVGSYHLMDDRFTTYITQEQYQLKRA